MEFALDAGRLIRMGSGIVWLALGLAVLWMRPGHPLGRPLGWVLAAFGARLVGINIAGAARDVDAFAIPFALLVVADAAGTILTIVLVLGLSRGLDGARRGEVLAASLVAVALGAVYATLEYERTSAALPPSLPAQVGELLAASGFLSHSFLALVGVATIVIAIRLRRNDFGGVPRPNAILIAAGLTLWFAYASGMGLVPTSSSRTAPLHTALPVLWWFAAMWGEEARSARTILLAFLSLALAGEATSVFAPEADDLGSVGVVRTIGAVIAAAGLFGGGWLEFERRPWFAERGTLAMASLASLFIVAQLAENYLGDEYGLVLGSVIAGAVLFAANPIQRAFERWTTGAAEEGPAPRASANDEVYRTALRLALKDRRVTREEELHLAELGERLGIGARRAMEIRLEVEGERDATAKRSGGGGP